MLNFELQQLLSTLPDSVFIFGQYPDFDCGNLYRTDFRGAGELWIGCEESGMRQFTIAEAPLTGRHMIAYLSEFPAAMTVLANGWDVAFCVTGPKRTYLMLEEPGGRLEPPEEDGQVVIWGECSIEV